MCLVPKKVGLTDAAKPPTPMGALAMLSCYDLPRSVFTPISHLLLRKKRLTLEAVARYPIIKYLRRYMLDFLQMLAPHWKRSSIERGVRCGDSLDTRVKVVRGAEDLLSA